jgi:hypothetical protein
MSRRLLYGLGALLVLGIVWFLSGFERVPATVHVGMSGEARLRPFLAAERFAERMGLPARELRALPELDQLGEGGVLIMPRQRQSIGSRQAAELTGWVAGGGHLIVEAEFQGTRDPLLDLLRIARVAGGESSRKPVAVEIPGGPRKLTVETFSHGRLDAQGQAPRFRVGVPGAEQILTIAHGKGLVTAALDLQFARNRHIGEHDHAELLWQLLTLQPAQELLVFHHPQRLSLWGFLVEHARSALIAAAALLALWLWRIGPRYGTVQPDPLPARRRLLDHLRASGRYFWSRGLRARLADAARDAALRRVARAYPDFAVETPAEQCTRLIALAGLSRADAEQLLDAAARHEPRGADFIRLVHSAQRVHLALEGGRG